MSMAQQPQGPGGHFAVNSPPPPPPYSTVGPQQLPTPTPPPQQQPQNAFAPQNQLQQSAFPPAQTQIPQTYQGQQSQFPQPQQQPQYVQSPQSIPSQPSVSPLSPPLQQNTQYPPNMTPQQQQQVEQMIQNLPPEKLKMLQQQAQQLMPQQQYPQQQQQQQLPQQPGMLQQSPMQPNVQQPFSPQQQQQQPLSYTTTAPTGLFKRKDSASSQSGPQDERKSGTVQRFLGDTLFGRVARASVQTATSAMKMPASLSPWGDNNPVTLPNVRYRDAVLFTTFAFVGTPLVEGVSDGVTGIFGAESFVSELVNSTAGALLVSTALKYSFFQIVEQAIDKGAIEHMLPEEEKMLETTNVKSLQVGIKHKLMGVDADLRFAGIYPTRDSQGCEKGWFCPYLFASARTPQIPRANDFAICQFFGPFLGGDYALSHHLLSSSANTLSLCDPNPTTDIGTNRMVILFTGISPYRANMWSTSRRPGCGTIVFHVFDGCPALVIPVTARAPICAWSPWTYAQMRVSQFATGPQPAGMGSYSAEWQHEQICEWLDTIISVPHVNPAVSDKYVAVLGRCVSLIINGALALERCQPLLGKMDPERAGIVMFRY